MPSRPCLLGSFRGGEEQGLRSSSQRGILRGRGTTPGKASQGLDLPGILGKLTAIGKFTPALCSSHTNNKTPSRGTSCVRLSCALVSLSLSGRFFPSLSHVSLISVVSPNPVPHSFPNPLRSTCYVCEMYLSLKSMAAKQDIT